MNFFGNKIPGLMATESRSSTLSNQQYENINPGSNRVAPYSTYMTNNFINGFNGTVNTTSEPVHQVDGQSCGTANGSVHSFVYPIDGQIQSRTQSTIDGRTSMSRCDYEESRTYKRITKSGQGPMGPDIVTAVDKTSANARSNHSSKATTNLSEFLEVAGLQGNKIGFDYNHDESTEDRYFCRTTNEQRSHGDEPININFQGQSKTTQPDLHSSTSACIHSEEQSRDDSRHSSHGQGYSRSQDNNKSLNRSKNYNRPTTASMTTRRALSSPAKFTGRVTSPIKKVPTLNPVLTSVRRDREARNQETTPKSRP